MAVRRTAKRAAGSHGFAARRENRRISCIIRFLRFPMAGLSPEGDPSEGLVLNLEALLNEVCSCPAVDRTASGFIPADS
jgi:hypothetical protein